MKFSELDAGDVFSIEGDGRRFMKIESGFTHLNAVVLYCPSNARTGSCVSFNDMRVHYIGSTQLDHSPNR